MEDWRSQSIPDFQALEVRARELCTPPHRSLPNRRGKRDALDYLEYNRNQVALPGSLPIEREYAATTIQRVWRGFWSRRGLWQWDGVLTQSRAVKIQKVWRGHKGRKIGLAKAKERLAGFANKIKGRYFIWIAKRLLRVKRAEWVYKKVTQIQCLYRCRLARAALRRARFLHHTRMATKIQALGRGRLYGRRKWGIEKRQEAVFQRMTAVIVKDIRLAQAKMRPTLENLVGNHVDEASMSDPWALTEMCFFHLLGTARRDLAVDLCSDVALKFAKFPFARFALQTALFLTWTCSGKNQHFRMDYLDELAACLYFNQRCDSGLDFNNVELVGGRKAFQRQESLEADPTSRYGFEDENAGAMDEIEMMYFRNCIRRHGKNAMSFSAMAACVMMRVGIKDFSAERTRPQLLQLKRAQRLLQRATEMSSNPQECVLRLEVLNNLFIRQHRPLLSRKIKFDGLKMVGYTAWHMLHVLHKQQLNDCLRLDVEVVKCGDMVVVKAELNELPLSLQKLKTTRKKNKIPHIHVKTNKSGFSEAVGVDMAPKWVPYGEDYATSSQKRKTEMEEEEELMPLQTPLLRNPRIRELFGDEGGGGTSSPRAGTGGRSSPSPSSYPVSSLNHSTSAEVESDHEIFDDLDEEEVMAKKMQLKEEKARKRAAREKRLEEEAKPEEDVPPVVIRPLVLLAKEVELLLELAVNYTAKERQVTPEEVRQEGAYNVLAEYLSERVRVVSCKSLFLSGSVRSNEAASLRVVLPQIEYRRLEQNNVRTVDYSINLLQRLYRGFSGKRRFRRLRFRVDERDAQHELHEGRRGAIEEVRLYRKVMVTKMQVAVKAWIWRRLIRKMRAAATVIQCAFRIFSARLLAAAERRRRDMGPEVLEMLRKSVKIGKLSFTVVVYRCGLNYRLVGFDLIRNRIYEGNVFQQEVERLLDDYNSKLKGSKYQVEHEKIRPWNHHRVPEFLVNHLGIAKMTPNVTADLGAIPPGASKEVLVMKAKSTADMPSIADIKNLNRLLKDTAPVVDRYNRVLAAQARKAEGNIIRSATGKLAGL